MRYATRVVGFISAAAVMAGSANASPETQALKQELEILKQQVRKLESRLEKLDPSTASQANQTTQSNADPAQEDQVGKAEVEKIARQTYKDEQAKQIDVGGAIRFQLARRGDNANDRATVGEIDLDTVRINFDGETPLDCATNFSQNEIAAILRKNGGKTADELKAKAAK
jgi:ankyrin repeat protein